MNSKGYFKIMEAAVNLIIVIMVEAGRVPYDSAKKVGENIYKAVTGSSMDKK